MINNTFIFKLLFNNKLFLKHVLRVNRIDDVIGDETNKQNTMMKNIFIFLSLIYCYLNTYCNTSKWIYYSVFVSYLIGQSIQGERSYWLSPGSRRVILSKQWS